MYYGHKAINRTPHPLTRLLAFRRRFELDCLLLYVYQAKRNQRRKRGAAQPRVEEHAIAGSGTRVTGMARRLEVRTERCKS